MLTRAGRYESLLRRGASRTPLVLRHDAGHRPRAAAGSVKLGGGMTRLGTAPFHATTSRYLATTRGIGIKAQPLRRYAGPEQSDPRTVLSNSYASLASASTPTSPSITSAPFPIRSHAVPSANEDLHRTLVELNNLAPDLVNQSRLQLALRGLESTSPVIRVGILGVCGAGQTARTLARLVAADPLGDEKAWESELVSGGASDDGRPVLLQHSEVDEGDGFANVQTGPSQNPLIRTVGVKSPLLEREGIELLIGTTQDPSTLDGEDGFTAAVEAALLPVVSSPLAGSSRAGIVTLPVHKSVLVADGFQGAYEISMFRDELGDDHAEPIETVINISQSTTASKEGLIDVDAADDALTRFRRDIRTGPEFGRTWESSGLADLSKFFQSGRRDSLLPKPMHQHLQSLLAETQRSIEVASATAEEEIRARSVPESTRAMLQGAITNWLEYAHTDLQETMSTAFASSTWRRTSFPRVLWRVDDVTFSATHLLHSNFLVETEAYLAFLVGRIGQAGFFGPTKVQTEKRDGGEVAAAVQMASDVDSAILSSRRAAIRASTGIDPAFTKPWPIGLTRTRLALLGTLVPALHARAQALVLQCLGLVGSTGTLGAWYVAATAGTGIYEAGAVVALGTVWALRHLQRVWGKERERFEAEVREQGRVALGEVEGRLRGVVRDGKRPQVAADDRERWAAASRLVERCREELKKLS